ncbi:vWA domain-containing protein [Candidatus Laterigemmans baculatus]|uniref:vWA domain-containing protein n=1 Tax=Candidatus Laterigemmans baculatus TaxID=2770505 RepID=UPI0013DA5D3D|nr:BatA and WFA domain-containing protein [Candidatus Laterigemmans baculatus]
MSFLPVLSAWQWALLAAVPVGVVLLYFLKLRRQPLRVPSTFLWHRAIEDSRVNSLLQRLRRNLMLFLQLLFLALAMLALLRPGWQGESGGGRRLILMLDASASMAATDVAGAATRFELAKQRIHDQIDAMRGNDVATLITFSDRPEILQEFTADHRRLRDALDRARVTHRTTDLREAIRGAAGLAGVLPAGTVGGLAPGDGVGGESSGGGGTEGAGDASQLPASTGAADAGATGETAEPEVATAELWIYSDGGFGPLEEASFGKLPTHYVPIGTQSASNLGIVAFSAERNVERPEQVEAFARIVNFGNQPIQGTASLTIGDELIDAAAVDVEAGGETGLSFDLESLENAELQLTLDIEDDLSADNTAYTALAPLRDISVLLITPGNRALQIALETDQAAELGRIETKPPSYLESDEYRSRAATGREDLIIYDRCAPAVMPAANTFFIGSLPPEHWDAGEMSGPLLPIDIDRTHPIMRFLDLFSLKIVEGRPLQAPPRSLALLTTTAGEVLAIAPRVGSEGAGYQDLVMGFEIISETEEGAAFNTDWPVQRSWPVFVYNLLRHLGGAVDATSAPSYQPGTVAPLRIDNQIREVRVRVPASLDAGGTNATGPAGPLTRSVSRDAGGPLLFPETERLGVYRVLAAEGAQPLSLFTINLFDPRESDLRPAASIRVGEREIVQSDAQIRGRSELWRWLLMAALGMLAVEWLVFNRRMG